MRAELARLESEIALCERCYGPEPRLPARFGRPRRRGRVLVLGERPTRDALASDQRLGLGHEDAGTLFLRSLLKDAGIPRDEVAIGAANLCRPVSPAIEAAVPTSVCTKECSVWLRQLVEAIEPRLIVTLGGRALGALRWAFRDSEDIRGLRFPQDIGRTVCAGGTYVHPLYHTTIRARVTRPEPDQRLDWRALGRLWQWIENGERGSKPRRRRG